MSALLSIVSILTCALQFLFGKNIGALYGERIGGGQGLGQKNTIFAIKANKDTES